MADRIIKGDSGNDVIIQNNDASRKIEVTNSGDVEVTGDVKTTTVKATNLKANDGTAGLVVADSTGEVTSSGGLKATNVKTTNLKANDGTASLEVADSTGDIGFSGNTNLKIKLPSAGGIHESDGSTEILTESSGTVSLKNTNINVNNVFPSGHIIQVQSKSFLDTQTINNNVFTEVGTGASGSSGDPLTITMAVGSGNKILFTGTVCGGGNSRYFGIIITKDNTSTYTWTPDSAGPATGSILHGVADGNRARILAVIPINDSIVGNTYMQYQANFNFLYTPGDTSSHTYTVKAGNTYNTSSTVVKINTDDINANNSHSARTVSTISALEVIA